MNVLRDYLKTSFSKSVLFDTGVLVDFLVGDKRIMAFFEEYVFPGRLTPVVSAQTVFEVFMATRNKREETEIEQWISGLFDIVEVSYDIAKQGGVLKRSNGIRAGDCIIAATAQQKNMPLVSTNPEAYRKANIRAFKPYL